MTGTETRHPPGDEVAAKGAGPVNGHGSYGFVVYAYDDPDQFRLVVWPRAAGPIPGETRTYDNRAAASFDLDQAEPQPITGGNIQTHN